MMKDGYFEDGDRVVSRVPIDPYTGAPPIDAGTPGMIVGTSYSGVPCVPIAYTALFLSDEVWVFPNEIELADDEEAN